MHVLEVAFKIFAEKLIKINLVNGISYKLR